VHGRPSGTAAEVSAGRRLLHSVDSLSGSSQSALQPKSVVRRATPSAEASRSTSALLQTRLGPWHLTHAQRVP